MQRRKFLQNATIASLFGGFLPTNKLQASGKIPERKSEGGYTVLFQGDSITDGNRTRNNDWNHVMGHGFAYIIASRLWCDFPDRKLHFYNRGISGNKVPDLAARWQADTIGLQPDLLSILVGINDCSAFINGNQAFSATQYESDLRTLLANTKKELPDTRLVLCDPFVLPVGNVLKKLAQYEDETSKRREALKRLAHEFDAIPVHFQDMFNKALEKAPAKYWIWDGIHPMPAGHELMAREWIDVLGKHVPQVAGRV